MPAMTMRPPPVKTTMTSASATPQTQQQLQHERHQHNESNCQQQLQFSAIQTKAYVELPPLQPQIKQQKIPALKKREIIVENHYNFADTAPKPSTSRFPYHYNNDDDDDADHHNDRNGDSIQLLDLSTSPPTHDDSANGYGRRVIVPLAAKSLKRSSVLSSTSSSEDEPTPPAAPAQRVSSSSSTTAALYDDAAANFIITYPAETPTRYNAADSLPLSETEPLLTNIHANGGDKQRSLCLHKNSASLIFTKKDLTNAPARYILPAPPNNNCAAAVVEQHHQSCGGAPAVVRRSYHQSLRSCGERTTRKQTKHLPASYLQEQQPEKLQRRSLQLNYNNNNNNLVTSTTSITAAAAAAAAAQNNNNCCGPNAKQPPQQKHHQHSGVTPTPNTTTTTTAAVSRKQHAYSWYAPVYSALEEELEQDSRDSSPIHNLANTKKHHHSNHYQQQQHRTTSRQLLDNQETQHGNTATADNETVALLETRKHINIQAQLTVGGGGGKGERDRDRLLQLRRPNSVSGGGQLGLQLPTSLPLHNGLSGGGGSSGGSDSQSGGGDSISNYADVVEGSLGLTGSQLPPRRRLGNFLKSLVGRKRNSASGGSGHGINATTAASPAAAVPASPEITITRTPSDQNMGVLRDPSGRYHAPQYYGDFNGDGGKLTNGYRSGGSTSSLNVVHQKLRNIMRREGSAASLHHEKSQSIVQYTSGMRKCETVLALTRQTQSLCSPVYGMAPTLPGGGGAYLTASTGSGIFNANGVEQIRPLNRLRNSVTSMNATCSRCSSILSLAASGSRYSLNIATGAYALNTSNTASQRQLAANRSSNALTANRSLSRSSSAEEGRSNQLETDQVDGITTTATTTTSSSSISPPPQSLATVTTTTPTAPHTNINLCPLSVPASSASTNCLATSLTPPPVSERPPSRAAALEVEKPFEMFTCKLCLIDVESAGEATTLQQCGCQFCTECMRAYVEFEICEAAYEISCPDAQCPTQGIMTPSEIATLTTVNLMKKHHRYRLNREIDLDKTRTWCPRAGCETVCHVGPPIDMAGPSTSTGTATAAIMQQQQQQQTSPSTDGITAPLLCAVQCPSCKDEFCSACKKTWHPNMTCEENGRRLAADGQDDIGIPFDNDLIKCCPMCAVPIEKDEGCAQMMCKRCKHVFCWYCLASLDDDFLLRHYDKGPCKNKLGHSRASVVWHRAQVIGIFAGFGILLLVASPLLLLAAPCIICCKCRSCSGSKIDDVDGELDEAAALQS